jgi:D-glycero-D-manno-heptose 1,7-bisphosphate phosphatase
MPNAIKALFLDRDGVINVNHGYVFQKQDCSFVEGIFELCQAAQSKGFSIIIVTNQSGIARNFYSKKTFLHFSRWMEHEFFKRGVIITHTYHCPHHPKVGRTYKRRCLCRKPRAGMIFKAQKDFKINLQKSIMIGDSKSDIACARTANIGKIVYFRDKNVHAEEHTNFSPNLGIDKSRKFYKAKTLSSIRSLL